MSRKVNVCVLFGGVGSEEEVSCNSGINCILQLNKALYNVTGLRLMPDKSWKLYTTEALSEFIDYTSFIKLGTINTILDGQKHTRLTTLEPFDMSSSLYSQHSIDIFFNVIHGEYGEDGVLPCLLDQTTIPYVGPKMENSAITINKEITQLILANNGIKVPKTISVMPNNSGNISKLDLESVMQKLNFPLVAKPNTEGSSSGLRFFKNHQEIKAFDFKSVRYLFQEMINGVEFTVPVLKSQGNYQAFKSIMLTLPAEQNFDYEAKYLSDQTEEICPSPIEPDLENRLQHTAIEVNKILSCTGITRTDMIYSPHTDLITVLEINTVPGMTKSSFISKFCEPNGLSFPSLLDKLIKDKLQI